MNNRINISNKPVCIGTGLVALDVIVSSIQNVSTQFLAGGSCGNVLTILSYLGWSTFPVARLSNNVATELLLEDMKAWNVNDDLITISDSGSTPIIIHRILKDKEGFAKHRFEFKNPENGKYLPSYRPYLATSVPAVVERPISPDVFYFDRINRAAINLANAYKVQGGVIFFEPSSIKDEKGFVECMDLCDVIKFSEDRIPNYDTLFPTAKAGLEIQTLGKNGLKFRKKGQSEWTCVNGYLIENVADTAGAGDWCSAGIIVSLFRYGFNELMNENIVSALKYGQTLSALNCMFEGARGLMYNMSRTELAAEIHTISSSSSNFLFNRDVKKKAFIVPPLKISSLVEAL